MDNALYTGAVFTDFQMAFNTVDEYKSNRFKSIGDKRSPAGNVTCGVPQGSISGLLLFPIYINNRSEALYCELFSPNPNNI